MTARVIASAHRDRAEAATGRGEPIYPCGVAERPTQRSAGALGRSIPSRDDNSAEKSAEKRARSNFIHAWARRFSDRALDLEAIRSLAQVDDKAAHVKLLLRLAEYNAGYRIETCGTMKHPCGHRFCPRCSRRWHDDHRKRLDDAFGLMANPTVFMLKIFTGGLSVPALKRGIASLSKWWGVLKRRAVMKGVTMLAGMMEVVPVILGGRLVWCVHLHAIADVAPSFHLAATQKAWREITGRTNSLVGTQELMSREAYLRYMSKMRDRCPWPGALRPAWLLKVLVRAMKGAHGWFEWGLPLTKRGRSTKENPIKKKPIKSTRFVSAPTAASSDEYDRDEDSWNELDADRRKDPNGAGWHWVVRAPRTSA